MKIIRTEGLKLPGGERKWRRMARLAGFTGTVRVRPFRTSDERKGRVRMGTLRERVITIHINTGMMRFASPRTYDPLSTFGHELGHYILRERGNREWATTKTFHSNAEQRSDPIERACDRYSRLLRARS